MCRFSGVHVLVIEGVDMQETNENGAVLGGSDVCAVRYPSESNSIRAVHSENAGDFRRWDRMRISRRRGLLELNGK